MKVHNIVCALALVGMVAFSTHAAAQDRIQMLTYPLGSLPHTVGSALGKVVTEKTKYKMIVVPYGGATAIAPVINRGGAALTMMNAVNSYHAFRGTKPYYHQAYKNLRLAAVGLGSLQIITVRADSGIRKGSDIKGKKVAGVYSAHTTCEQLATAALANLGLSWKDVRVVPFAQGTLAVKALGDGRVDVAPCSLVGHPSVREVNAKVPVRVIGVDPSPKAVARFRNAFPSGHPVPIKKGSAPGVEHDTYAWKYNFYLDTQKDASADVVYSIVKTIWENKKQLGQMTRFFKLWPLEGMAAADMTIPYHRGAVRFFKEKGIWTPAMETRQEELLKLAK